MKEAILFEPLSQDRVRCRLCSHRCLIRPQNTGTCNVRLNQDGRLYTLVYGQTISGNADPIEKKPLFHFLPGTISYSVATVGCNLVCDFCQNHQISQMPRDEGRIMGTDKTPEDIVAEAKAYNAATIAYTYTEPTIYFEYALDTARIATKEGLKNIFVTNGYMTAEALEVIGSDLHGANVDLKAFSDDFYKKLCGARLKPVLQSISRMVEMGVWVEVTTLIIPGYNDDEGQLRELAQWLVGVSPDIPWHISRFHPTYRLQNVGSTPPQTLHRAMEIGLEAGLKYVYTGNVWGDEGEKTLCHNCKHLLIDRVGYRISSNNISAGSCPNCQASIPGVWV